jgi:hypothetical protein
MFSPHLSVMAIVATLAQPRQIKKRSRLRPMVKNMSGRKNNDASGNRMRLAIESPAPFTLIFPPDNPDKKTS